MLVVSSGVCRRPVPSVKSWRQAAASAAQTSRSTPARRITGTSTPSVPSMPIMLVVSSGVCRRPVPSVKSWRQAPAFATW
eukprot:6199077-Pleurochrysis_carterae.AAC.3